MKTNILSVELQTVCYDYGNVRILAQSTISKLDSLKDDKEFEKRWSSVKVKAEILGIEMNENPRQKRPPK